jgi:hypothetical protein
MKMDWSKILIIGMGVFIVFIVSMGVKMAMSDSTLYEDDYYEQGEDHNARMEMEANAKYVNINYIHSFNSLKIEYDSVGSFETIKLVCLADGSKDQKVIAPKKMADSSELIPLEPMQPGTWFIEVQGWVNGVQYFKKFKVTV